MFGKWRLRGARLQTLTARLLSKEYESGSQTCSQKLVFVPYVFSENSTKIFSGSPKVTKRVSRRSGLLESTYSRHFSRRWESQQFFARARFIWENCSTSKGYPGQTTYLRQGIPWKALHCFSRNFSWHHSAQFSFIVCTIEKKVLSAEESTSLYKNFFLRNSCNKLRNVRSESKPASKPTVVNFALSVPQFKYYASLCCTVNVQNFR